jgi:RNA polymerase sigma factor (TIGR02999 family)
MAIPGGRDKPLNEFMTALYPDLHRIAARQLRGERYDHTLQPTALLHEAYLKLSDDGQRQFNDRVHFLAIASRVMRQVLVDYARARATSKRAGARVEDDAGEMAEASLQVVNRGTEPLKILELDHALEALAQEDKSLAQLIEMRYFGGMTAKETAEALGCSAHIVRHDLRLAQAWLRRELRSKAA